MGRPVRRYYRDLLNLDAVVLCESSLFVSVSSTISLHLMLPKVAVNYGVVAGCACKFVVKHGMK